MVGRETLPAGRVYSGKRLEDGRIRRRAHPTKTPNTVEASRSHLVHEKTSSAEAMAPGRAGWAFSSVTMHAFSAKSQSIAATGSQRRAWRGAGAPRRSR